MVWSPPVPPVITQEVIEGNRVRERDMRREEEEGGGKVERGEKMEEVEEGRKRRDKQKKKRDRKSRELNVTESQVKKSR